MNKYLCKFIDIFSKNNREQRFCAFLTILFLVVGVFVSTAQKRSNAYEKYIKEYSGLAVEHREQYGIPASITLAQGLLESGAGQSRLAREANNHFGIKCGNAWRGKTIKHDDDRRKECFRKYKRVEESYADHSLFLKGKRYESLFKYDVTDYKNWARGLRKCGYATDKKYADKLIKIIEDYRLYRFDKGGFGKNDILVDDDLKHDKTAVQCGRTVYYRGKLRYIISAKGDTYEGLATLFGIKHKQLFSYNDVKGDVVLPEGSIVYLKEKGKKYAGKGKYYEVQDGETLYLISQKLGVQLKHLRKRNKLEDDAEIKPADRLKVR